MSLEVRSGERFDIGKVKQVINVKPQLGNLGGKLPKEKVLG